MIKVQIVKDLKVSYLNISENPLIVVHPNRWSGWNYPNYSIKQAEFYWVNKRGSRRCWSTLSGVKNALLENPPHRLGLCSLPTYKTLEK